MLHPILTCPSEGEGDIVLWPLRFGPRVFSNRRIFSGCRVLSGRRIGEALFSVNGGQYLAMRIITSLLRAPKTCKNRPHVSALSHFVFKDNDTYNGDVAGSTHIRYSNALFFVSPFRTQGC